MDIPDDNASMQSLPPEDGDILQIGRMDFWLTQLDVTDILIATNASRDTRSPKLIS